MLASWIRLTQASPASKRNNRGIRLQGRMISKFPKKMRLRDRRGFAKAFAGRCRLSDDRITIYVACNGLDTTRLGLAVGRVLGNSVRRNRLKRLLREAFRRLRLGAEHPGYDLVCIPRPRRRFTLLELEDSMRGLFARGVQELEARCSRKS